MTIVEDRLRAGQEAARKAMIDSQLRPSGVNSEWTLRRMNEVPREDFVPAAARGFAYMDRAIELDGGGFLPAPIVQGAMLQEARPTPADKALLVDGGSGYLAELVRPLVGSLDVITPAAALALDGSQGQFTLLLIDGAVEHLPEGLVGALAEEARVVTGMVEDGITRIAVGTKVAGAVSLLPLAEIGIPALPEFAERKSWSF